MTKAISVTLYAPPSTPHRWKAYATQFLRRLDTVGGMPRGWTLYLYHDERVSKTFLSHLSHCVRALETREMSGDALSCAPACWRFLVHDEPGVDVYYCMDMDSAFYDVDMRNMALLDDTSFDGVVAQPTWLLGDTGVVSSMSAGGFGLRPERLRFCMKELLEKYIDAQDNVDACGRYFFDEIFLHDCIFPIVRQHRNLKWTTRENRGMCGKRARIVEKYRKCV